MSASPIEIRNILAAIAAQPGPSGMALATVVDVQGSAYRRTGARMAIHPGGTWTGSISGGCLEGNALRQAREVLLSGQPRLITYDTRADDDARAIGASLGCNGIIKVWLEPIDAPGCLAMLQSIAEAQVGSSPVRFTRLLSGPNCGDWMPAAAMPGLHFLPDGLHQLSPDTQILMETVQPALSLVVFGAGDDARPLCTLAAGMGWRVKMSHDCGAKMLPTRFPEAESLHLLPPAEAASLLPSGPTAAVLLSHNYNYDLAVLRAILPEPPLYIGVLGPASRHARMCAELGLDPETARSIHAPVGLDIGAEGPYAIAVAIIAEIQAAAHGRAGGYLRERDAPIHIREGAHA